MGLVFTAKDGASFVMGQIQQRMLDLVGHSSQTGIAIQKNFAQFSIGMAAVGAGATMVGGAIGLANIAGTFNKELTAVGALAQANAEELKLLHDAAIDAGIATQFSPTQAVGGLQELAQAGYNATEATKLLLPTLDLAAGGQLSVAQAAATMSSATKIFGLGIEEAATATDKLLRISNATSLNANDLQIALGNVSRGAITTGQSLDEMLPSIGLVKNAGVDASVASSAVSSALLMVAKNAGKFKSEFGVQVTDAAGKFRPLMSIILETEAAMKKKLPNAADRSAKAMDLFGKFGLTAFSAMSAQLTNGITGSNGQKIFGQEAVDDLRMRMATAKGAAAEFRDKLLDTFEGQKTLMKGSLQTLAIVLGEPFERALKPIVSILVDGLNKVIQAFRAMPNGMKDFIAKVVLAAGALTSLLGALVAGKAAIAMLMLGMKALGITSAAVFSTFLPMVAVLGLLVGGLYALKYAADNNIGGFGTKVQQVFKQVETVFTALGQLFSQGGLSGDMADAFLRGDNAAVNFAVKVYVVVNRIIGFFEGMWAGISAVFDQAQPSFEAFGNAVEQLGLSFMGIGGDIDAFQNEMALDDATASGQKAGATLGSVLVALVNVLTSAIEMAAGFTHQMDQMGKAVAPVGTSLSQIASEFSEVGTALGLNKNSVDGTAGGWMEFGAKVGSAIALVLGALRGLVSIGGGMLAGFLNIVAGVADILYGIFTLDFKRAFTGLLRVIYGGIRAATAPFFGLIEAIAGVLDAIRSVNGTESHLADSVASFRKDIFQTFSQGFGLTPYDWQKPGADAGPAPTDGAPPEKLYTDPLDFYSTPDSPFAPTVDNMANAEAGAAGSSQADIEGLNEGIASLKAAKEGQTVVNATMTVDGEVLATVVANAQAGQNASGGGVTPVAVD